MFNVTAWLEYYVRFHLGTTSGVSSSITLTYAIRSGHAGRLRRGCPTASYFFLLVQAKVTKKKNRRSAQRTLTGFIMDTPPSGLGNSHGAQTNARYDPVLLLVVNWSALILIEPSPPSLAFSLN